MSGLHFAEPQYVHGIWLVLACVALLIWLEQRRSQALDRFVSKAMNRRLVTQPSRTRRFLSIGLLGLCGVSLVVALMRPQFGLRFVRSPRVGAEVMVCLDVSRSMLATDVAPNRLERAKAEVDDLLHYLDGDHVGLIAFAGKATVLCPLTPDFGFLKLTLQNAGPESVARGGTSLEAPIRKAIAGFRGEADVSRAILLITDGEDHDSKPTDAAKAAGKRGIRILAFGFGDEAGSEIQIRDPKTGARESMLDADGKPVISRLDGEKLRDMAKATDGAYIPAGTGALDLKSIYDAHIARLTRGSLDDRGRMVRDDAYPWAILAALLFLLASVAVAHGRSRGLKRVAAAASMLFMCFALFGGNAYAEDEPTTENAAPSTSPDTSSEETPTTQGKDGDPRTRYNRGVAALARDSLDEAARELKSSRESPRADGEARYASAYNLGWVEVRRAEALLKETPKEALEHLKKAAKWFRDAVALSPKRGDARHNLDVVTRRIIELVDTLNKSDPKDTAKKIDELIKAQRGLMPTLASALELERSKENKQTPERTRAMYRRLSISQRKVIADLGRLAKSVREETEGLMARKEEERDAKTTMRMAQLSHASHYLDLASQRLNQGRSQLRRKNAARGFRRASAGLDELKRARDQFRGPVEVLGVLIREGVGLVRATSAMAAKESDASPAKEDATPKPPLPAWLDAKYMGERQAPQTQRLTELHDRIEAALKKRGDDAAKDKGSTKDDKQDAAKPKSDQPPDPKAETFFKQARVALPSMAKAKTHYEAVPLALDAGNLDAAATSQGDALQLLVEAREHFLDLKGLIEVAYGEERALQQMLTELANDDATTPDTSTPDTSSPSTSISVLLDMQKKNDARLPRMRALLAEAKKALEETPAGASPSSQGPHAGARDEKTRAFELERQAKAETLQKQAHEAVQKAMTLLEAMAKEPTKDVPGPLTSAVDEAVTHLTELRRLYFTIVEHVRETLRRQLEVGDQTQQLVSIEGTDDDDKQKKIAEALAPHTVTQGELRAISTEIAKALEEQAAKTPAAGHGQGGAQGPAAPDKSEAMKKAAALVDEGASAMGRAIVEMAKAPAPLEVLRTHQEEAAQKLAEALATLQPPPPPDQKQQQKKEKKEEEKNQEKKDQKKEPKKQDADPSRLLQSVRDREAKRRKDKSKRGAGNEPVDKDW